MTLKGPRNDDHKRNLNRNKMIIRDDGYLERAEQIECDYSL